MFLVVYTTLCLHELKRVSLYIFNSIFEGYPIGLVCTEIKPLAMPLGDLFVTVTICS